MIYDDDRHNPIEEYIWASDRPAPPEPKDRDGKR